MGDDAFADYYEDLQVSPNADQETVERVYRLLAKRYHPDNRQSGSVEKFDAVTKAYRTLGDPVKRAAYDAGYETVLDRRWKLSPPEGPSAAGGRDREVRGAILAMLYAEKRSAPLDGAVGLWRMEKLLGWPEAALEFHVWYLKEKGLLRRTDSGGYAITADGVDAVEAQGLRAGPGLLLPEKSPGPDAPRRPGARDGQHAPAAGPAPPPPPGDA
jgi:hypothetical protein